MARKLALPTVPSSRVSTASWPGRCRRDEVGQRRRAVGHRQVDLPVGVELVEWRLGVPRVVRLPPEGGRQGGQPGEQAGREPVVRRLVELGRDVGIAAGDAVEHLPDEDRAGQSGGAG